MNKRNAKCYIPQVIRKGKHVLPTIARFCLIATFFEDGLRMWFQWNEQREYMDMSWGCGKVNSLFIFLFFFLISFNFNFNFNTNLLIRSIEYAQFLATVFVLVNLFGQLGGCGLVIARFKVEIACGMLFFIVVLQVSDQCDSMRLICIN